MNSYQIVFNDELYHHGVKGQKWGRRKQRFSLGRYLKKRKNKNIQKRIRTGDIDYIKKHPEKFTDKQIEAASNRRSALNTLPTGSKTADRINAFNNRLQGGKSKEEKPKKTLDQKLQTAGNVLNVVTKGVELVNKAQPLIKKYKDKETTKFLEEAQEAVNKTDFDWMEENGSKVTAKTLQDFISKAKWTKEYKEFANDPKGYNFNK